MENNDKLKRNLLQNGVSKIGNKIAKLLPPAFLAATMLNCATATAKTNKQPVKEPTPIYREATVNNYTADEKSFKKLYDGKLFNMTKYDTLEKQVHIELARMLAEMNEETIKLSTAYKTMETESTINANMPNEEINHIAKERGAKTSDTKNMRVAQISMQHFLHLILDTTTLVRLGAEEAEISILDEHMDENGNEYLRFNTQGQRDIRTESEVVLNLGQKDITAYTAYVYNVAGKNGNSAASLINSNLSRIKALINTPGQSKAEYNNIMTLVEQTANLLPASVFGNREMRKALVLEYVKQYTANATLDKMEKIGYDLKDFRAEDVLSKTTVSLDTLETTVAGTTKGATISMGLDAKVSKPTTNFDLKFGGEMGYKTDENSLRVLGKVEPGYTFKNGHRLSMPLKAGLSIDLNDGALSTPFGAGLTYNIPLNNKMSIDFGGSSLFNVQNKTAELGGMVGVNYRTKKINLRLGLGFGKTLNMGNSSTPTRLPDDPGKLPDDPGKNPDNPGQNPGVENPPVEEPTIIVDDPTNNVIIERPKELHNTTITLPTVDADPTKLLD